MKFHKSPTETLKILYQAFVNLIFFFFSQTQVFDFKTGQRSDQDDGHSGRPITSKTLENVGKEIYLLHENCH